MSEPYGKQMMVIRKSTIEPVIGNLIEYLGMRKVNTIGIKLANKCMLMAGMAYNLEKLIKNERNSAWTLILNLLKPFHTICFAFNRKVISLCKWSI